MNVRKMRQIGKDILAEHRRFNMGGWINRLFDPSDPEDEKNRFYRALLSGHSKRDIPACGTTACFAGSWAIRYRDIDPYGPDPRGALCAIGSVPLSCGRDLGLPNHRLFYVTDWPMRAYLRARGLKAGTRSYARFFVEEVLEDYIETDGWQKPSRRFA